MSIKKLYRLEGLKFLGGSLDLMELFTDEYQTMLREFAGDRATVRAMREILGKQTAFVLENYLNSRLNGNVE